MDEKDLIVSPPKPEKLPDNSPQVTKEGKVLKGWSLTFFILTCIVTSILAASIVLPFFVIIFGLLSALIWFLFLVVGTIFTIGLMWTVDGVKAFNQGWMSLNDKIFNSSSTIANTVAGYIPVIAVIGSIIVLSTWIMMIVGITTDKSRRKYYTVMMIILGVLSILYIVIAIVTILINGSNNATPTELVSLLNIF